MRWQKNYPMRYILYLFILLLSLNNASAQTHIGVDAGYTYSNARIILNDVKQTSGFRNGFKIELMVDVPFENKLHFSPTLDYHYTGYQAFYTTGSVKHTENNINVVALSPALSFNFPSGKNKIFIVGFSPVIGVPLGGKEKSTFTNDSTSVDKLKFAIGSDYGQFDLGVSTYLSYQIRDLVLKANWFIGLTNLDTNELHLRNIRDQIFSFTVGYYFK